MMARVKSRLSRADKAELPPEEMGKLVARASLAGLFKSRRLEAIEGMAMDVKRFLAAGLSERAATPKLPKYRANPVLGKAAIVDATLLLAEVHRIMESNKVMILREGTPQMLRSAMAIVRKLVWAGMCQGWLPMTCPRKRPARRGNPVRSAARKRPRR